MTILLIGGSPATPSSSSRLLHHVGDELGLAAVAAADAVVIATPVYEASFSCIRKSFLDLLPQDGLAGKLVLPLATGGSQSHMLALDYALRPVLHALEARHVLTSIYATSQQLPWQEDSGLTPDVTIAWRVAAGVEHLSDSLYALHGRSELHVAGVEVPPPHTLREQAYVASSRAA